MHTYVKMEFSMLVVMLKEKFKIMDNFANVVQINKHFQKQWLNEFNGSITFFNTIMP